MPLRFEDMRLDCELYNGYKPCAYGNRCPGCVHYRPNPLVTSLPNPPPPANLNSVPASPDVLIIKTGAMGDVLRTTALLHPLVRRFPGAHVTWITDQVSLPLLESNPHIRCLLAFNESGIAQAREGTFDLLINFEKERDPMELAAQARATVKTGFAPTEAGAVSVFNSEAIPALMLGLDDELKFFLNQKSYPQIICEAAGFTFQRDPYILTRDARVIHHAAQFARQIPSGKFVVGLNTGCGAVFRTKQWNVAGWIGLTRHLLSDPGIAVVVMGGSAERELNAEILAACPEAVNAGTENPLPVFFGIVDTCDLVVSSDTLGMHIAIALEKHVVALFGSTSHVEIDLYGRGEKVITDYACSPCYRRTCDINPMCMDAMRWEDVAASVQRQIEARRALH